MTPPARVVALAPRCLRVRRLFVSVGSLSPSTIGAKHKDRLLNTEQLLESVLLLWRQKKNL